MRASTPAWTETAELAADEAGPLAPVLDWLDPRFGPIVSLGAHRQPGPEPEWWIWSCELARPLGRFFTDWEPTAAGTSLARAQGLQRVLGEAVERTAAFRPPPPNALRRMPAGESPLFGQWPRCAAFERAPQSMKTLAPDVPLVHARARRLADGSELWVPAQQAHMSFPLPPDEPLVSLLITTGMAFDTELHRAVWAGLCELAERDALMRFWWTRQPVPRLRLDGAELPDALAERVRRVRSAGLRLLLFDMSTDFRVPTVFGLILDRAYPWCAAAGACHADPVHAAAKTIDELVGCRFAMRSNRAPEPPSLEQFHWVSALRHHAELYAAWPDSPALRFLVDENPHELDWPAFAGADWWPAPDSPAALAQRAEKLEGMGLTPLWLEVTPEDAPVGRVVRAIVPQMLPLSSRHAVRWLATPRLLDAAGGDAGEARFHPHPHPFA